MKTLFQNAAKLFVAFSLLFTAHKAASQNTFPANGAAGIGTNSPNTSSMLEVTSTAKGVLLPRMTRNQRDAIATPATGLIIYQTNSNAGFYYYTGSGWSPVTPKPGWLLKGNNGIDPNTNFLGTTDAQPIVIRTNNTEVMRVESNGNVGIGTANPVAKLEVVGDAKVSGFLNGIMIGQGGGSDISNTEVGYLALSLNTSGTSNTATGNSAMYSNISGSALTANGYYALASNSTGKNNTAMGYAALGINKDGSNNTALGFGADVKTNELSNATAIGSGAIADASNKVRIGDASVSSYSCQVNWTAGSDSRIKDNVHENVPGLKFIEELRPVTFHYNVAKQNKLMGTANDAQWEGMYNIEKIAFTGFIAQEVDAAAQKIGYDFSGVDKSGTVMGLRYAEFVVPLVKAVQELNTFNTGLQSENEQLSLKVDAQQKQIDELKTQMNQLLFAASTKSSTNDGAAKISIATETASPLLGQNIPNPFDNSTVIPFRIPKGCSSASIVITESATGRIVTAIPVSCDQTHAVIDAGSLASGTYQYTLYIDGKTLETRQMNVSK